MDDTVTVPTDPELAEQISKNIQVSLDSEVLNYEDISDDEEDIQIIEKLKSELLQLGYTDIDDLEYSVLEGLKKRLYSDEEKEQRELQAFIVSQKLALQNLIDNVSTQQATLLKSYGNQIDEEAYSTFSSDTELGKHICMLLNKLINEAVRTDPNVTERTIYNTFMELMATEKTFTLSEDLILKYINTLTPIIKSDYAQRIQRISSERKIRARLAEYLNSTETANTNALLESKSYAVIRQINCKNSTEYTTVCPRCGKETKITAPVFRFVAYATEKTRSEMIFFIGNVPCEHCNTSLLFTRNEYVKAAAKYKKECGASIDAFLSTSKTACAGAAQIVTELPISIMRDTSPYLFIDKHAVVEKHENLDVPAESKCFMLSDAEFNEAVRQFYFKLNGKRGESLELLQEKLDEEIKNNDYRDMDVERENINRNIILSQESLGTWTYHKAAVFITQCMSKDYYVEHKRALFSLIFSLKSNPYLCNRLSMETIWDLENKIAFIKDLSKSITKGAVPANILVEVDSIMAWCGLKPVTQESILTDAAGALSILEKRLNTAKSLQRCTLAEVYKNADAFSYTKLMKMNTYNFVDLQTFLATEDSVRIFNEIADRMIIRFYAKDYFDYWKTLGRANASTLTKVFEKRTDFESISKSLNSLHEKFFYTSASRAAFKPIYDRISEVEDILSAVHNAFMRVDLHAFCCSLNRLPTQYIGAGDSTSLLVELLTKFSVDINKVASQKRSHIYLSDFTSEELDSYPPCDELIFERYTPVRLPGESIKDYCERYEQVMRSTDHSNVNMHDNTEKFAIFSDYFVRLSICSAIQDAGLEIRGKTIFAYVLVTECCGMTGCEDHLEKVLGISKMQQNIINAVMPDYVNFVGYDKLYKIICGFYSSSIAEQMDALHVKLDEATISTSMKSNEILKSINLVEDLRNIVTTDVPEYFDDSVDFDSDESDYEMAMYFGGTFKDLIKWLGIAK